jgi:hypothetical protein
VSEVRTNLFQKLATHPDVYAIVKDRVYPVKLPQGSVIPAISYQLVSGSPMSQCHNEPSAMPSDMYQINCWAQTSDLAAKLKEAVKKTLDGQGGWWDGEGGKLRVDACIYKGQREISDPEGRLFCRQTDFKINYREEA